MAQKLACREWWIELDYLIMILPCTVKAQGKVAACMLDYIYILGMERWVKTRLQIPLIPIHECMILMSSLLEY
jgi:hypothetical protein